MDFDSLFEMLGRKKAGNIKVMIALLSVILVIGAVYIYMEYYTQNEETKQYLNEMAKQSAELVDEKIISDVNTMQGFVYGIVRQDEITRADIIKGLEAEYELFDRNMLRLSYIMPDGTGYAITDGQQVNFIKMDISSKEFKSAFNGQTVITASHKDTITNELVNSFYVPVVDDSGLIIAVHCGINRTEDFQKLVSTSYFDEKGGTVIVDSSGNIVSEPQDQEHISATGQLVMQNKDQIASVIQNNSGYALLVGNGSEEYWLTFCKLETNDWYMLMVIPEEVLSKMSDGMELFNYILVLLIMLICIATIQYINSVKNKKDREIIIRAYTDDKTGLLNKEGMSFFVERLLATTNNQYAFVYFDIESFKTINDIFGYTEGDLLLKHIADILTKNVDKEECVGRFGGDNFYAAIKFNENMDLVERVEGIMSEISEFDFSVGKVDKLFDIIVYAGVYKISNSNRNKNLEFFADRANMSMSRVVKKHKNAYAFYNDQVRKNLVFETELENEMYRSLQNGDFEVYIQPKYDVKTSRLAGGEALIRWNHPEKGFLTPNKFIHVFERNGMIIDLDMFVLETVCKKQKEWKEQGLGTRIISVNQSRIHLYRNDYIDVLKSIINKYGVDPACVELEITETVAMASSELLSTVVEKMHDVGFKVSMDDFGSGQSALNLLKDIDIDVLKLDRSFFLENSDTVKGKKIIESVLDMATRLDIETVSEGIETMEQFDFIKEAGCNLVQSFLFGKPMPISEYEQLFKDDLSKG